MQDCTSKKKATFMASVEATSTPDIWRTAKGGHKHRPQSPRKASKPLINLHEKEMGMGADKNGQGRNTKSLSQRKKARKGGKTSKETFQHVTWLRETLLSAIHLVR